MRTVYHRMSNTRATTRLLTLAVAKLADAAIATSSTRASSVALRVFPSATPKELVFSIFQIMYYREFSRKMPSVRDILNYLFILN